MLRFPQGFPTLRCICVLHRIQQLRCSATASHKNAEHVLETALSDIITQVVANGGQIPFSKLISATTPSTKQVILSSGKGLEGFLKQHKEKFRIATLNGTRCISLVDKELEKKYSEVEIPQESWKPPPPPSAKGVPSPDAVDFDEQENVKNSSAVLGGLRSVAAQDRMKQEKSVEKSSTSDPNQQLKYKLDIIMSGSLYYRVQELFAFCYSREKEAVKVMNAFENFFRENQHRYWIEHDEKSRMIVSRRHFNETQKPKVIVGDVRGHPGRVLNSADKTSKWGPTENVPTSKDIYEILKYTPIHWTPMTCMGLPLHVRKAHIRCSSMLLWFARQPRYFDVRINEFRVLQIRRSPLLNPKDLGMTEEQAQQWYRNRVEEDRLNGGECKIMKEARAVTFLRNSQSIFHRGVGHQPNQTPDATSASSTVQSSKLRPGEATTSSTPTAPSPKSGQVWDPKKVIAFKERKIAPTPQPADAKARAAAARQLLRVCPGYFITERHIQNRASKNLSPSELEQGVHASNDQIEMVSLTLEGTTRDPIRLYRRKTGLGTVKWGEAFKADFKKCPGKKIDALIACMNGLCSQWDRTHFLYVRLPDPVKVACEGFDGMVDLLKSHPMIFRTGNFFVSRLDLSDPAALQEKEPTSLSQSNTRQLEDNSYLDGEEMAKVLHYLTPEDGSAVPLSHFYDNSSPAMRSVLPARIITLTTRFPNLFQSIEVSPGVFRVSRTASSTKQKTVEAENSVNTKF